MGKRTINAGKIVELASITTSHFINLDQATVKRITLTLLSPIALTLGTLPAHAGSTHIYGSGFDCDVTWNERSIRTETANGMTFLSYDGTTVCNYGQSQSESAAGIYITPTGLWGIATDLTPGWYVLLKGYPGQEFDRLLCRENEECR